ncbi:MAG TPA: S8 family serine peptidase [Rhodanobacteraceae bacterium]
MNTLSRFSQPVLVAALSALLAGSLSACGGGGNVRPTSVSPAQSADPCVANPSATGCSTPPADGQGGGGSTSGSDGGSDSSGGTSDGSGSSGDTGGGAQPAGSAQGTQPAYVWPDQNQLVPTHVDQAQTAGFTGRGVKVAVMDSGLNPASPMLQHTDYQFHSFLAGDAQATANDTLGHGTNIVGLLAGTAVDGFTGGVAPDAQVYVGQICSADGNCHMTADQPGYFLDQGVKLFNYSMGDSSATRAQSDASYADFLRSSFGPVVDAGGLVVWAAGNDGVDSLSGEAAAPKYLPALQKGWLVAVNVAVDRNDGHVTGLYQEDGATGAGSGSAQCGVAMDWCLAAPGYERTLKEPGTGFATGYSVGTSNSTAIITGVAAQVWQAFPWMSGHNVQQTLLTTATHLGDGDPDQPNATYGWGLVNAIKAVHGPGQFVGEFDAAVGDDASTFANAIGGSGSLVLSGQSDGVLTLSADNTFAGGTTINGATLDLTGALASSVTLAGGMLTGDGSIHADVINTAGSVYSTGTTAGKGLTVDGNYTAGADATTRIALDHPLSVGKTATLAGTLQLVNTDSAYTPKASEKLIGAGQVQGTFATVDADGVPMYTATVQYDATTVTASMTRVAVTTAAVASTPVVAQTAPGVEKSLQQADQWSRHDYAGHQAFLDTAAKLMAAPTRAAVTASVASLSGQVYATLGAVQTLAMRQVDAALGARQQALRDAHGTAFWMQGLTHGGGLAQTGYASARWRGQGELIGMEAPLTAHLAAGAMLGRQQLTAHLDALAGRVRSRADVGGVYARYGWTGGTYLAGRATWLRGQPTVQRTVLVGVEALPLKGQRHDNLGRVTLEAGRAFGEWTPYLAGSWMYRRSGALREQGGAGFGLAASAQVRHASTGSLGVRWAWPFAWAGGASTVTGDLAWQHVLSGTRTDFTAALAATPDALFSAPGQALPRDVGALGVTLRTRVSSRWGWFVQVAAQGAQGRYHAVAANAGLRIRLD